MLGRPELELGFVMCFPPFWPCLALHLQGCLWLSEAWGLLARPGQVLWVQSVCGGSWLLLD